MDMDKKLIKITPDEKVEVNWEGLQRAIEERRKTDEIERRASLYIPFIGSILFTIAILLVKFIAY
jgi:hypothetical protein